MGVVDETRYVERLQFFNGQQLFASDLQDIEAFNREMRWLHNRSLHQPGIGSGFAVYGKKGDRAVTVKPGYALDDLGREIILTQPEVIPIHPVAGDGKGNSAFYYLTVSYPDDSALEKAETREGICLPRGTVRLREAPVFCWVRLEKTSDGWSAHDPNLKMDIQTNRKLILALIEVLNCQLKQDICIAERTDARPACGPYIYCGKTSFTKEEALTDDNLNIELSETRQSPSIIAYRKVIDTSMAGFLITPKYSANVQGGRLLPAGDNKTQLVIYDRLQIEQSHVDRLNVFLQVGSFGASSESSPKENDRIKGFIEANWELVWMGIES